MLRNNARIGAGCTRSPLFACLASAAMVLPGVAIAVTTQILPAQADVFVFEGNPGHNANDIALLQAGIGRGREVGRILAYIRFDLANLPKSSLIRKTRVTQATIRLFAQSLGLAGAESRFFVSIIPCWKSDWSEERMTWANRVCPDPAQADDVAVIDGTDLPQLVRWDVKRSITEAIRRDASRITFIITGFRLKKLTGGEREIIPGERFGPGQMVGFVRFWSRERAVYGGTAVPTLLIGYEQDDSELARFMKTTFAILSALGVIVGIWEGLRRIRKA